MRYLSFVVLFLISLHAKEIALNTSKVCQKCHPLIYQEYITSAHFKSSIYDDKIHKAIWDRHPLKKKNKYNCKKCHTPVNKPTSKKTNDGYISCVYCHKIKDIKLHAKSNTNIIDDRKNILYGARASKENQKNVTYGIKSSFFGLISKESGSAYHDIDFSNKNFYNSKTCMGCHSHKQNSLGFNLCKVDFDTKSKKKNCIDCHMQKVEGSFSTVKESKQHRFHGFSGVLNHSEMLSKYIDLDIDKKANEVKISIKNNSAHDIFLHPLRKGVLDIFVDSKKVKTIYFYKIIGKDGKKTPPWLATSILKDTTLKANEKRVYKIAIADAKSIEAVFGFYKIDPKVAKKFDLDIKDNYVVLKRVEKIYK
jgi:hypothetical protein